MVELGFKTRGHFRVRTGLQNDALPLAVYKSDPDLFSVYLKTIDYLKLKVFYF